MSSFQSDRGSARKLNGVGIPRRITTHRLHGTPRTKWGLRNYDRFRDFITFSDHDDAKRRRARPPARGTAPGSDSEWIRNRNSMFWVEPTSGDNVRHHLSSALDGRARRRSFDSVALPLLKGAVLSLCKFQCARSGRGPPSGITFARSLGMGAICTAAVPSAANAITAPHPPLHRMTARRWIDSCSLGQIARGSPGGMEQKNHCQKGRGEWSDERIFVVIARRSSHLCDR